MVVHCEYLFYKGGNMESRIDKAERLFKEGYNCSQAVVGAFCDIYGLDQELAFRLSASFGAGLGRMREVCGAVSGMGIIAGLENGAVRGDDTVGKKENYDLVVSMANKFKEKNGTIICRELLGLAKENNSNGLLVDTTPQERNDDYYKTRPCVEKVRECARIIEDLIISKKNNK